MPFKITPHLLLTLLIGSLGGMVLSWLHLPLAWMMGSMLFTTIAALSGVRLEAPRQMRLAVIPILGVLLGAAFSPQTLSRMHEWGWTMAGLFVFGAVVTGTVSLILNKLFHYDGRTAFLSAAPGGINDLILLAQQYNANDRAVSLMHAIRILVAVMTIPLYFRFVYGITTSGGGPGYTPLDALSPTDALMLAACALLGYWLGKVLKLPAYAIFGPMILSAALHFGGFTAAKPPTMLIQAAQVIVGATIGCRFLGVSISVMFRDMLVAAGSGLAMVGLAVGFAAVLSPLTGFGVGEIVLAFSPGGLMEMGLISIAMGFDPAFVSAHHLARIVMVIVFAPLVFKLIVLKRSGDKDADDQTR
ncbi:MAG: AbrB family transcriptional regulator [Rhodospirillum sp.]|nr:AbrB family transcriptional regulator [Rhodospirillum sp.]MCF8499276.1 AbrB family transcriptional regulator [Rhodospirillum sp.]